ncbi:unnamed protein product [Paramecium octaurelia]|uniref:Uncharacterized protein n=1 Tax=Paramecium octaurelia TaxID=43137 RepID=A0A8S1VFR5_PAROT|nr:unnamed protein product [Paramecium octaurelia]
MDWKTEKALLEQENELLEMQLKELREREDSYKIFNESMLNAYNSMQNDVQKQNSNIHKQLQQTLEQFSQDLIESRNRNNTMLQQMEKENRNLKDYLELLEFQISEQKQEQMRELEEFKQLFPISQEQNESAKKMEQKKKKKEDKENCKPERGGGCIISRKARNEAVLEKELNVSNVLNCKNSNLLEISQMDWLDQSSPIDLFKQYQLNLRGRDNSNHSQRMQPQLSKREIVHQRKSDDSISPSYINERKSSNNVTTNGKRGNYEFKLITSSQLMQKDNIKKENQTKFEKKSLDEFTRQLNSFKSAESLSQVYRRSQLS